MSSRPREHHGRGQHFEQAHAVGTGSEMNVVLESGDANTPPPRPVVLAKAGTSEQRLIRSPTSTEKRSPPARAAVRGNFGDFRQGVGLPSRQASS